MGASIDTSAILVKFRNYIQSQKATQRARDQYGRFMKTGVASTARNDKVLTKEEAERAASELIDMIKNIAAEKGVAVSILDDIDNMQITNIRFTGDLGIEVTISFNGGERMSVDPGYGSVNIILLYNSGVVGHGIVVGEWHGEEYVIDNGNPSYIAYRKKRSGFIDEAIDNFSETFQRNGTIHVVDVKWHSYV